MSYRKRKKKNEKKVRLGEQYSGREAYINLINIMFEL